MPAERPKEGSQEKQFREFVRRCQQAEADVEKLRNRQAANAAVESTLRSNIQAKAKADAQAEMRAEIAGLRQRLSDLQSDISNEQARQRRLKAQIERGYTVPHDEYVELLKTLNILAKETRDMEAQGRTYDPKIAVTYAQHEVGVKSIGSKGHTVSFDPSMFESRQKPAPKRGEQVVVVRPGAMIPYKKLDDHVVEKAMVERQTEKPERKRKPASGPRRSNSKKSGKSSETKLNIREIRE